MLNQRLFRFITYGAASITVILGMIVIMSWQHYGFFTQISSNNWVPTRYNTAISFILAGLSLIALNSSALKISRFFTVLLLILSGIIILQYFLNHDLGIDQILIKILKIKQIHPAGKMPLNTALSLLFIGLTLWWFASSHTVDKKEMDLGINLIISCLVIVILVSLISALTMYHGISQSMKMSFRTLAGLIILSVGLVSYSYQNKSGEDKTIIQPLLITFIFLLITFLGWQSLIKSQYDYLNKLLQLKSQSITSYLTDALQERKRSFLRISYRWLKSSLPLENEWNADAMHYIKDQPGYVAMGWADQNYITRWLVPIQGNEPMKNYNWMHNIQSQTLIKKALATQELQVSPTRNLIQGEKGVFLVNPLFKKKQFKGLMIGLINMQKMMHYFIHNSYTQGYDLKIYSNGQLLYRTANKDIASYNNGVKKTEFPILGQIWKMELWPSKELFEQVMSPRLPLGILMVGILVSLLAGFLIRTLQRVKISSIKLNSTRMELADTNERLTGILEGSTDLIAALDVNYSYIAFNTAYKNEVYRIFKVTLQKGMKFSVLLERMSLENQKKTRALWKKALKGQSFTVIESFQDKLFSDLDFEIRFNPICNARGELVGASHTTTNISYRLHNEKKLIESKKELERMVFYLEKQNKELALLEEMMKLLQTCNTREEMLQPIATYIKMILSSTAGAIYFVEDENKDLHQERISWGEPISHPTEIQKSQCWALLMSKIHQVTKEEKLAVCEHVGSDLEHIEVCICHPLYVQGVTLGLIYMEFSVKEASSRKHLIYLFQILSEQISLSLYNINLREELKRQSTHDDLTGLYNRRFFEEFLEKEVFAAKRIPSFFSMVLIDIDHFKKINDNYGHLVGDKALQQVATELHNNCRKSDVLCRWGGEEFFLFLRDSSPEDTVSKVESIRQAIENLILKIEGIHLSGVTISIGVAFYPLDGEDLDTLTAVADDALYQAKERGRNRVAFTSKKRR